MFPKIFCLQNARAAPRSFKTEAGDIQWKDSNDAYCCKLDGVKGEALQQFLIFTEGAWPVGYSEREIDIYVNNPSRKLCSLTRSQRCFLWSKDNCEDDDKLMSGDANKLTLYASSQATFTTVLTENLKFSSPKQPKLSEGEFMQKANETTPEVNMVAKNVPKKSEKLEKEEDSPLLERTPGKQLKENSENVTPTSSGQASLRKSKKRQLDKESSSSATPKLKTARCRVGSKKYGPGKTPPSKRALAPKVANDPMAAPADAKSDKVVRCVELSSRIPKPSSRWGHSMCMVDDKKALLIGGQGNKMQLSKDSIWTLDTECRVWKSVDVTTVGMKPECRTGHSATFDPTMRCIYVFGGSKNSKWFHDVHMYDLDEQKWTLVKANGKAPTRAYHSTTLYRHELWIFGGVFPKPDPQPDGCDNELHIFSPVMEGWYKPIVTGEKPIPRSGHSANLVDNRLVVFGGWDFPFCYNDINILDLTTLDWSKPEVQGEPPKPRCWSASTTVTNSRVFIHGGYDGDNPLDDAFLFALDTFTWEKLVMDMGPSSRAGHACIRLCSNYENQDEDEIIVFGGGDNDGNFFSDMLSFYVPFVPAILD